MSAVSHGTRHLRQGIGGTKHYAPGAGPARSIHIPAFTPPRAPQTSAAQRIFTNSRNLVSRFFAHLTTPGLAHSASVVAPSHSLVRPAHFHSTAQSVKASYSLPVRNALYRPLSLPHLPRPPRIPGNVAYVGLGTARSFHSARPIFQNVVDNVPIATRALWEAEWEFKAKKKEERRLRKAKENVAPPKTKEMLKQKQKPIVAEIPTGIDISELDHYLPQPDVPEVTTYLLVPLAPTPTARLPLSAQSTTGSSTLHPLLPVSDIAAAHRMHRNHSLRVSTLFSRLDAAKVWDDPGVSVDAYAFGTSPGLSDSHPNEKQCTVLRVTFAGWTDVQVRGVIGESGQGWCEPEEVYPDTLSHSSQMSAVDDAKVLSSPQSVASSLELDSACVSELDFDKDAAVEVGSDFELESDEWDFGPGLAPSPESQHNFILPTLDFSSSFAQVASPTQSWAPTPQIILRTASELAEESGNVWSPTSLSPSLSCDSLSDLGIDAARQFPHVTESEMERSWLGINMGLSSSFTERLESPWMVSLLPATTKTLAPCGDMRKALCVLGTISEELASRRHSFLKIPSPGQKTEEVRRQLVEPAPLSRCFQTVTFIYNMYSNWRAVERLRKYSAASVLVISDVRLLSGVLEYIIIQILVPQFADSKTSVMR
ncbi:uncharacterized protein EDB91DRAFT_1079035 [Suillus paluster]|uniref:uncharacterized protein n=1 Tax=Suillus paluster TaxID=48578 RepID=UPI001B870B23|nr:uncharacterized protein EDB91DRAFT_1079035 [Suillus paluster]KAG1748906.1 hypothetical protein EDB91DRAFT_1079035 [Suillus paluster]